MKNAMDYETLDWEAEAAQVAQAFGVEGEFVFVLNRSTFQRVLKPKHAIEGTAWIPFTPHRLFGTIRYPEKVRFYCRSTDSGGNVEISIWQDGTVENCRDPQTSGRFLAKPLFHLGLLTPEVEVALRASVTAHQKLEWALEYEARYGL